MSRLQRGLRVRRTGGFILLPVVLALMLVADVAFLLNRSGGMNMEMAAGGLQADSARYVAEAGLARLHYQIQSQNCAYTDLPATTFGPGSVSATVRPTSGSPVTLVSSATLAGGATSTLTRSNVTVYQTTPYTLTLQPGAADGIDAWLDAKKATSNYGTAPTLWLDTGVSTESHPLIRFDLSSIPFGSVIVAATLSLNQAGGIVSGSPVINVHRILQSWVEGTQFGSGTADGATWITADGVSAWTNPGGAFDSAAAASSPATAGLGLKTWDVGVLVDGWVNGAYLNYGMLLKGSGNISALRFDSSDGTTRPKLDVSFRPPCGSLTVVTLPASGDTWLDERNNGSNWGGTNSFTVSNAAKKRGRALVSFDLSSIPTGTTLKSATLRLNVASVTTPSNSILSLNAVAESWTELGATWKSSGYSNWSFGGNYVSPAAQTATISSAFTSGWVEWDVKTLAQQWVGSPSLNYGTGVLIDTSSTVNFNSKEATTLQPQLVLTY